MKRLVYVFLGIILIVIVFIFISNDSNINLYGKYNCSNNNDEIMLILNKDKTFEYNDIKGTYTHVLVKDNNYALDFDSTDFKSQMQLSIKEVNGKKQGNLMLLSNNEIYNCIEE